MAVNPLLDEISRIARGDTAWTSSTPTDYGALREIGQEGARNVGALGRRSALNLQAVGTAPIEEAPAVAKMAYNPNTKQILIAGRVLPQRFDVMSELAELDLNDIPEMPELPEGFLPLNQDELRATVTKARENADAPMLDSFVSSLKSGTGAAISGVPRMLGYDVRNPYGDAREQQYAGAPLNEQAAMDAGAFDSVAGFGNAAAEGMGNAAPAIATGLLTTAATANPIAGLAAGTAVGASGAAGADSEEFQSTLAQMMGEMDDQQLAIDSPAYAQLRRSGVPRETAIDMVAFEASRVAGAAGAATTIPESLIGGKLIGNFVRRVPGLRNIMPKMTPEGAPAPRTGALGAIANRWDKVPGVLRVPAAAGARGSAAGAGEGLQEVAENVATYTAGSAAAGIGSTDPGDYVDARDFEQGFAPGFVFGVLGGRGRAPERPSVASDLDLAMQSTGSSAPNPNAGLPPAGPPLDMAQLNLPPAVRGPANILANTPAGQPGIPDLSLEQQRDRLRAVIAERYGPDWENWVEVIAQNPGNRQLLGQLMGVERELEQQAAGLEQQTALARRGGLSVGPTAQTPIGQPTLQGPAFGDPAPAPGEQGELPGMGMSQGMAPQPPAPAAEPAVIPASQGDWVEEGTMESGPGPNLLERRTFQRMQQEERAAQSAANPLPLPGPESVELEQQIVELTRAIDERKAASPRDPRLVHMRRRLKALEAEWEAAKLEEGPRGVRPEVDPNFQQDLTGALPVPEPQEAPAARAPAGDRPLGVAPAPLPNPEPMSDGEAASRAQVATKRTGRAVSPAEVQATAQASEEAVTPTTAEPSEDLAAQVAELTNPKSARDAVFVAEGNEAQIPPLPAGVKRVARPGVGTLLTSNPRKAARFKNGPINDSVIAGLLGLPETKADALASGDPVAVQAKTPAGAVAAEALSSRAKAPAAAAAVKALAPEATVTQTTPEAVQAGRKGREAVEAGKARGAAKDAGIAGRAAKEAGREAGKKKDLGEADDAPTPALNIDARGKTKHGGHRLAVGKRAHPIPASLLVRSGSNPGPVDLGTVAVNAEERIALTALVTAEHAPLSKEDTAIAEATLTEFDQIETMLDAAADAAQARLLEKYEKEAPGKASREGTRQLKAERAEQEGPGRPLGKPKASPLYYLPLLASEMTRFAKLLRKQASFEANQIAAGTWTIEHSNAIRMLEQLVPRFADMVSQRRQLTPQMIQMLARATDVELQQLVDSNAASLQNSTLAKQVVRGPSEVAHVAARGENDDRRQTRTDLSHVSYYEGDVPKAAVDLINGWAQMFERTVGARMADDLRVLSVAQAKFLFPGRVDIAEGRIGQYVTGTIAGKRVHAIVLRWKAAVNDVIGLEVLAHEMGHFVGEQVFARSDDKTQRAVNRAFMAWRKAKGRLDPMDILRSRMTPALAASLEAMPEHVDVRAYATDFHEWLADNVAKYLLTKPEPKGLLQKFFARVGKMIEALYKSVAGEGAPDRAVAAMLDHWVNIARSEAATSEPTVDFAETTRAMEGTYFGEEDATDPRMQMRIQRDGRASRTLTQRLDNLKDIATSMLNTARTGDHDPSADTWLVRKLRLGRLMVSTVHDMDKAHEHTRFGQQGLHPWWLVQQRMQKLANTRLEVGSRIIGGAMQLGDEARTRLENVMYHATFWGIHPELAFDDAKHAHLQSSDKNVLRQNRRRHAALAEAWEALGKVDPRAQESYVELRDEMAKIYADRYDAMLQRVEEMDVSEATKQSARAELNRARAEFKRGPYFPLMRHGEILVEAMVPADGLGADGVPIREGGAYFADKLEAVKEQKRQQELHRGGKVKVEKVPEGYMVRVYGRAVYFFDSSAEAMAARPEIEAALREHYAGLGLDFDAFRDEVESDPSPEGGKKLSVISLPRPKRYGYEQEHQPGGEFLARIRAMTKDGDLTPEVAQAFEQMLIEGLPEMSFRKALLPRQNVLGASRSMLRGYAQRYVGAAHNLAAVTHGTDANKAWSRMAAMTKEYPPGVDVMSVLKRQQEAIAKQAEDSSINAVQNVVTDLSSMYSLALSPAYILANAAQPWMVSVPVLAGLTKPNGETLGLGAAAHALRVAYSGAIPFFSERGWKDFKDEMMRAMGKGATGQTLEETVDEVFAKFSKNEGERAMLQDLYDRGRLDFSFLNSLQDAMRGSEGAQRFGALMRMGMAFPQQVEAMNRVTTALAAYRIHKDQLGLTDEADVLSRVDDIVRQTQLDYSKQNRPLLFNKPLLRVVLQFKMYLQGMYMLMARNAMMAIGKQRADESDEQYRSRRKQGAKTLLYFLTTHAAVGGTTGLLPVVALAKAVAWPVLAIASATGLIGDEDDEWKTGDDIMRSFLTEYFGETGARTVTRGLPALAGVDLADRLGLPALVDTRYMSLRDSDDPGTVMDKVVMFAFGAPYANAKRLLNGAGAAIEGDTRGTYKALPAGLRSLVAAGDWAANGIVDPDGDTFIPVDELDWGDIAIKSLGFQSAEVAEAYRQRSAEYGVKGRVIVARTKLLARWRNASSQKRGEMREEIEEFNASVPDAMKITPDALRRSSRAATKGDDKATLAAREMLE